MVGSSRTPKEVSTSVLKRRVSTWWEDCPARGVGANEGEVWWSDTGYWNLNGKKWMDDPA